MSGLEPPGNAGDGDAEVSTGEGDLEEARSTVSGSVKDLTTEILGPKKKHFII